MNEDLYDRLRRQENWNLSRFAGKQLVICGDGKGMTRTLALAALCSGWPRVAFVGDGAHRMGLIAAAEELTLHAGLSACLCRHRSRTDPRVGHRRGRSAL
jgi:hypothetical protein